MKSTSRRALYVIAALLGALFILACLAGFAACGGGKEPEPEPEPTPTEATVSSVSISPSSLSLKMGATESGTLTATVKMSDGTNSTAQTVNWTSSDTSVATVSATGYTATVTALKDGTTNITASVGSVKSAACVVSVAEADVEPTPEPEPEVTVKSVSVSPETLTLKMDGTTTGTVTATVTMSDDKTSTSKTVNWTSSVPSVATVTETGYTATVTAVGAGTTEITASVGTVTSTNKCTVTVEAATAEPETTEVSSAEELAAALETGGEIALTNDITSSSTLTVSAETEIDLGGYTLTGNGADTITVTSAGSLTVTDNSTGGTGKVDVTTHQKAALVNEGTVTLEGGTFERSAEASTSSSANGGNSYYTVVNHGTMTIEEGATIFNKGEYSSNLENGWASGAPENASATLTINGGHIYGGLYAIKNDSCGTLYIYGGTIGGARSDEDTMPYRALLNWNEAYIYGGTLLGGNGSDSEEGDGVTIYNRAQENDNNSVGKLVIGKDVEKLEAGEAEDVSGSSHDPEIWYEGQGNGTSGSGWGEVIYMDGGTVTVNSGRVWGKETKCGYGASGIGVDGGTLTVNGGVISGAASIEIWAGSVTINGGDIAEPIDLYTSVAGCSGTLTFGTGIKDKFTVTMYDEDWDETNCENSAYCIEYTQKSECELNGHILTGTYDSTTSSWTYACSVCGEEVALDASTPVKSLTLEATDYDSLKAAGAWNEATLDVVPLIEVTTAINMTADVDFKDCAKDMVLNADITVSSGYTLNVYTDMTLDLNGHSISVSDTAYDYYVVQVGSASAYGNLTVKDSSAAQTGKISSVGKYVIGVIGAANNDNNTSVFTLEGGTIESTNSEGGYVIHTQADSSSYSYGAEVINIKGGKVTSASGQAIDLNNGTLNVSGGTISGKYGIAVFGLASSNKSVTVNVTGGTIEGTAYGISTNGTSQYGMEVINVSGGTVTGGLVGIYLPSGSLTVSGGEISGVTGIEIKAGSASITGGTISTTVEDGQTSVNKGTGTTDTSGFSIAIIAGSGEGAYKDITSVSISGCTLTGTVYVDASVDSFVTVCDGLDLAKDACDESGDVIADKTAEGVVVDHYIYRAKTECEKNGHTGTAYGGIKYAVYCAESESWCALCEVCGEWFEIEGSDIYSFVLLTTDEVSLNAAIKTAKAREDGSEDNRTQILVCGTIQISEDSYVLIDCDNVEIYGLGAENSTIKDSVYDKSENSGTARDGVEITGSNVTIRDLTIDGSALNNLGSTVQYSHAVEIRGNAANVTISDCVITGGGSGNNDAPVCVYEMKGNLNIVNCILSGAYNGFTIVENDSITITVSGGSIGGSYRGIFLSDSSKVTLDVNGTTINGKNSINTSNSVVTFTGCTFGYHVDDNGILVEGSMNTYSDVTFINCNFLAHDAGTTDVDAIYKDSLNYVIRPRQEGITLTFLGCTFENTHTDLEIDTLAVSESTFIYLVSSDSVKDCYLYFSDSEDAWEYLYDSTNHIVEHNHTWVVTSADATTSSYECTVCGETKIEITVDHVVSATPSVEYIVTTVDGTVEVPTFAIAMSEDTVYDSIDAYLAVYTADSVTWSSSDTSVATVDESGAITIVGAGNTTITVTFTFTNFTASYILYVGEAISDEEPLIGSWQGTDSVTVTVLGMPLSMSIDVYATVTESGFTLRVVEEALNIEVTIWEDVAWFKADDEYYIVVEEADGSYETIDISYNDTDDQLSTSFKFSFTYIINVTVDVENATMARVTEGEGEIPEDEEEPGDDGGSGEDDT